MRRKLTESEALNVLRRNVLNHSLELVGKAPENSHRISDHTDDAGITGAGNRERHLGSLLTGPDQADKIKEA